MFKSAGQHKVTILEAYIAEPKFSKDPTAVDVAIKVRGAEGEEDSWTGEISNEYGVGNAAGKKQWELTVSSLERIGWSHGINISDETLTELVGHEIDVGAVQAFEKDGKTPKLTKKGEPIFNIRYLGAKPESFGPKKMEAADAKARLAALFGASAPSTGAAPVAAAAPSAAKTNPFKK
jgi:hypothetical protein